MKKILRTFSVVCFLLIPQILLASPSCPVVRGVIDVGSSNTKIKVNVVDKCEPRLWKTLIQNQDQNGKPNAKNSVSVDYSTDPKTDNMISNGTVINGLNAIFELKKYAETDPVVLEELKKISQKNIIWQGIGTSAFRTAANGDAVLSEFSEKTGIPFHKISGDQEARYGFTIAIHTAKDPSNAIVWDIGSKSQQISDWKRSKSLENDESIRTLSLENKASKDAKNVISAALGKTGSPNPIGKSNYGVAVNAIEKLLEDSDLPVVAKRVEVIGIGGVNQGTMPKATGKNDQYSIEDVHAAIQKYIDLTDDQIKEIAKENKYYDSFVTNLILVETMMRKLNVINVKICNYSIADGYMLQNEDWKSVNDKIIDDIFNTSKDPKGSLYKDLNQTDKDKIDEIFEPL